MFSFEFSSGLAELLVEEAISSIFLNPLIWVCTVYKVQRELYMFLIQQFDHDPRLLKSLCRLPRVLDIIHLFYCDNVKSRLPVANNLILHPITERVDGERPSKEEIRKIRLLLLSLGEMSLRYSTLSFVVSVGYYYLFSAQFFILNFGTLQAEHYYGRYKSSCSIF